MFMMKRLTKSCVIEIPLELPDYKIRPFLNGTGRLRNLINIEMKLFNQKIWWNILGSVCVLNWGFRKWILRFIKLLNTFIWKDLTIDWLNILNLIVRNKTIKTRDTFNWLSSFHSFHNFPLQVWYNWKAIRALQSCLFWNYLWKVCNDKRVAINIKQWKTIESVPAQSYNSDYYS